MLALLMIMLIAVGIRVPLLAIITVHVMRLVEAGLIDRLGHAFCARKQHSGDYRCDDETTHPSSLHISRAQTQFGFTFSYSGNRV